jgi:hypothetical protein
MLAISQRDVSIAKENLWALHVHELLVNALVYLYCVLALSQHHAIHVIGD